MTPIPESYPGVAQLCSADGGLVLEKQRVVGGVVTKQDNQGLGAEEADRLSQ